MYHPLLETYLPVYFHFRLLRLFFSIGTLLQVNGVNRQNLMTKHVLSSKEFSLHVFVLGTSVSCKVGVGCVFVSASLYCTVIYNADISTK